MRSCGKIPAGDVTGGIGVTRGGGRGRWGGAHLARRSLGIRPPQYQGIGTLGRFPCRLHLLTCPNLVTLSYSYVPNYILIHSPT